MNKNCGIKSEVQKCIITNCEKWNPTLKYRLQELQKRKENTRTQKKKKKTISYSIKHIPFCVKDKMQLFIKSETLLK